MTIYFNKGPVQIDEGTSLLALLENKGFSEKKGIAVAINNQIIRKLDWPWQILNENDNITLISATKGG